MLTETHDSGMRGDQLFVRAATRPPFSKLHPRIGVFFKEYLAGEKAVGFHGKTVVNTHFPQTRTSGRSPRSARCAAPCR